MKVLDPRRFIYLYNSGCEQYKKLTILPNVKKFHEIYH